MSRVPFQEAKHVMRVAFLWNGTVQGEEILDEPVEVVVGLSKRALFPLPEGAASGDSLTLLEPSADGGYQLRLTPRMGGYVFMGGQRKAAWELAARQSVVVLDADDYGLITIGSVAFFFQQVIAARKPQRTFIPLDASSIASWGLSLFLHAALIVLFFLAQREMPQADPLELPTALVAKFMVVPPPEDILEQVRDRSGTDTEDPGLKSKQDTGGRKQKGPEGRVGKTDALQEQTEIQGENRGEVATKVRRMGLLGALSGGRDGNAIANALDVPSVGSMLSGLDSSRTITGRGSGGYGLRGTGSGGGGTGPGNLFGAGNLGTGVGAGTGGAGRGAGGVGVKGKARQEVKVGMTTGTPRTNGYLSPEQIDRVVRAHKAALQYCYDVEVQRQPRLRGRIEVVWRVSLDGSVTTARVGSSTMSNAKVEGCIVRQVRRWQFPKPDGGECVVSYPFIFGVQGG